jgi:hypothetical protein
MAQVKDFLTDPALWISSISLVVSISSAIFSGLKSSRALAINEKQEKRRQPQLSTYFANGYRRLVPRGQVFAFQLSVSNPSDINNSVARAELQIEYEIEKGVTTFCRVQHNPDLGKGNTPGSPTVFSIPLRIEAHGTVSGLFLFALDKDVIRAGTVNAHTLLLEDAHGVFTETNSIMVREWVDETQENQNI